MDADDVEEQSQAESFVLNTPNQKLQGFSSSTFEW